MAKLFISYSRKDSAAARKVIQALAEMGQDIWVDWEDIPPGSAWMDQIKQGIERSDAFVFLLSPDSIISGYCTDEVNHARKNNKRILPVVIRQVRPEDTIDIVRQLHWIFLREEEDFGESIQKIKFAIELDFEWVEQHTSLQTRALEWESKKEPSLLLRGANLRRFRQVILTADQNRKDPLPSDLQKSYVEFSRRNERRNWLVAGLGLLAILALAVLSYTSFTQRNEAINNRAIADQKAAEAEANRLIAEQKSQEALESARKAEASAKKAIIEKQAAVKAQRRAEESRKLAAAQRSAALAQIYQTRPGELFTSTLLAIDSWQTDPSDSAEEILRQNISLLPIPLMQMNHAGRINTIAMNSDGTIFVTAGADGMLCAWQVTDGKELFCVNSAGAVTDAVITPDNQTVVAGDDRGNLLFINLSDGSVSTPIPPGSPISDLDIQGGRDPRFVAVTTEEKGIALINWKTGQKTGSDLRASGIIKFAIFSPNGLQIATGSEDGLISVWDLNRNDAVFNTRKHIGEVITLKYSPDGRYLVSGGADGAAVVLDARTGSEVYRSLHSDQVRDIAFSRDSKRFVTASKDRYVRVWETDTGKQLLIVSHNDAVQSVRLTENNRWVVTTGDDRTVRVWNALTGTEFIQIPIKGRGTALALSPDGKILISGDQNGWISLWDLATIPAPDKILQFDGVTTSALYSPSGTWIAASDDRQAWLLNPKAINATTVRPSGSPILELRSHINRMIFSPRDRWIGVLTAGNEIVLYNTQSRSGRTIAPANPVNAYLFSPDERVLFTGDASGRLQLWDLTTSTRTDTPVQYDKAITALAATADLLLIAATDEIHVLDINTFQEFQQPKSIHVVHLLAINAEGTWLASSNSNGQIQFWQKQGETFTDPKTITTGGVASLAFAPGTNLLAVGVADNLLLIDPATREEYARIPITGTANSVSFSPDGLNLMTSSLRVLQFWDPTRVSQIKKEGLIETACGRLVENFSREQWELLFRGEEYQPLCQNRPVPVY